MSCAVVTPWHNHEELWDGYMAALERGPMPSEVIVVDNGSDPRLAFTTVRNAENRGYAAASNQGLRLARADVVVFLNNDVTGGEPGWLQRLTAACEPGVLAGPRLRRDLHTAAGDRLHPYLDGWCIAGPRQGLLELGGFDEALDEPAYFSDNLLCLEARAAGYRLREVPGLGLAHLGGATSGGAASATARAATLTNRKRYEARAVGLMEGARA